MKIRNNIMMSFKEFLNEIVAYENGKCYFVLPIDFKKNKYDKKYIREVIDAFQHFVSYNKDKLSVQIDRDENRETLMMFGFPDYKNISDKIEQKKIRQYVYEKTIDLVFNKIIPELNENDFYRDTSKRKNNNRIACYAYEFIFKNFRKRIPEYKDTEVNALYLKFEFLYTVIKISNDKYEFITPGKNRYGDIIVRFSQVTLNNISIHI